MRKRIMITALLSAGLLLLSAGCGTGKKDQVSEPAAKVIDAMMTCPNKDLFDLDAAVVLGAPADPQQAEKAQQILQNWEDAIGKYFAEGTLQHAYNNGLLQLYLGRAAALDQTISVKATALAGRQEFDTYSTESVDVTLTVGDEEEKATVDFTYDADGLITEVIAQQAAN